MTQRPPVLPPAFGLLMMLGIFTVHFIRPLAQLLPYPLNYLGLLPIVAGVLLSVLAEREFRQKGLLDAHGQPKENQARLVTSGVYRFSRNPAFLGQVLILAGVAMWVGSLAPWAIVIISIIILQNHYIAAEEAQLQQQFQDSYRQYCRLVPRWLLPRKSLTD